MKLKISYDKINNFFCFDYSNGILKQYKLYAAIEALNEIISQRTLCYANSRTLVTNYINNVFNGNIIKIEV